jgi:four helix bundle protein
MHNYRELILWKKSMHVAKEVYLVSKQLPSDEHYGLNSQIKRAAISIMSNIAEGTGRNSDNEFIQFLSISNGSCCELIAQLELSIELKLLNQESIKPIVSELEELQKMNYSLQKKLGVIPNRNKNSVSK